MSNVKYEVKMLGDANSIQMNLYGFGENCRLDIHKISEYDGGDINRIILPIETIFNYVKIHAELEDTITEKDRTLKERNEKIKKLEAEIKDLQEFRNDYFRELIVRDAKIKDLESRVKSLTSDLGRIVAENVDLEDKVEDLRTDVAKKDTIITGYEKLISAKQKVIVKLENQLLDQNNALSARESKIIELDSKLKELEDHLELNDTMIANKARAMNEIVSGKDVEIARLKRQLNIIYGSQSKYSYASIAQNVAIGLKDIEIDSLKAENERLKSGVDKAITDLNNLNTK